MLFDLTEDQQDLQRLAKDYFAQRFPAGRLRAFWTGEDDDLGPVWRGLAEIGVLGLAIPEEHGGLGLGQFEFALVLEEAGYVALPSPLMETAAVAAPLIARFGSDAQRAAWLEPIASGEAMVTIAIDGSGFAVWGRESDVVVALVDGDLHLVPSAMIEWTALATDDEARRLAMASYHGIGPETLLAAGPEGVKHALALARSATAAALVGISQRMLDMTVEYSLQRQQFGRVIGSFQALKHRMADMAVSVQSARGLAWYSAYAQDHEPDMADLAARTAKSAAAAAGYECGRNSLQLHGGIGFTFEYDLNFWLKRGRALEAAFGNASDQRVEIGRSVLREMREDQISVENEEGVMSR